MGMMNIPRALVKLRPSFVGNIARSVVADHVIRIRNSISVYNMERVALYHIDG